MNWVIIYTVIQKLNADGTPGWALSTTYSVMEHGFVLSNDESKLLMTINTSPQALVVIDTSDTSNIQEYSGWVTLSSLLICIELGKLQDPT